MTKQKRGFLLFLASLIPGAGELYMGFRRQGISIMVIFWGIIALASANWGFSWIIMFAPILWFYSFFNVHNLKSLSEEEFYTVEDTFILHIDEFLGDAGNILTKHRKLTAIVLILLGLSMLWSILNDILYWAVPNPANPIVRAVSVLIRQLPQVVIAVALIAAGYCIITDKKHKLDQQEHTKEAEHFWQPYRPYQPEPEKAAPQEVVAKETAPSKETETAPQKEDTSANSEHQASTETSNT